MKKKTLSIILSALLILLSFTGCGEKEAGEEPALIVTTEQIPDSAGSDTVAESTAATAVQLPIEELSKEQQNMLAVMDSLNMCMVENQCDYTPEDPAFLWTALFYTLGNYPDLRDNDEVGLLTIDNSAGTMIVHYKLVQEYAAGITETYSDLPALPEGIPVVQNADTEYYDFPMGDRGLSYGKIASWTVNSDGTHTVEVQLIGADDESLIAAFEYVLTENSYAKGIADPIFVYTVRSAKRL